MKKIKIKKIEYFIRYETLDYYLISKEIDGSKFKIDKIVK